MCFWDGLVSLMVQRYLEILPVMWATPRLIWLVPSGKLVLGTVLHSIASHKEHDMRLMIRTAGHRVLCVWLWNKLQLLSAVLSRVGSMMASAEQPHRPQRIESAALCCSQVHQCVFSSKDGCLQYGNEGFCLMYKMLPPWPFCQNQPTWMSVKSLFPLPYVSDSFLYDTADWRQLHSWGPFLFWSVIICWDFFFTAPCLVSIFTSQ